MILVINFIFLFMSNITFNFTDANKNLVSVEYTFERDYNSFIGEVDGHIGQCDESIKPANNLQRELLKLWNTYHLKNESCIELVQALANKFTKLQSKSFIKNKTDDQVYSFFKNDINFTNYEHEELLQIIALARLLEEEGFIITKDLLIRNNVEGLYVTIGGREYIVGNSEQCEEEARENISNNLADYLGLNETQWQAISGYFDEDAFINDNLDVANELNRYDSSEDFIEVDTVHGGASYYLYRQ